jgi:serine/threonine protein kinase
MELCAASLDHLLLRGYNGPMPSNEQVLLQLANGLGYLHSLNILHGDIKPENILISSTLPVQMKWTGFGFRQSNDSYSLSMSGPVMGSRKWWPPEMYEDETKASQAGEIFSAGCVFLYFLSGGFHPFGSLEPADEIELKKNVTGGNPVNLKGIIMIK